MNAPGGTTQGPLHTCGMEMTFHSLTVAHSFTAAHSSGRKEAAPESLLQPIDAGGQFSL